MLKNLFLLPKPFSLLILTKFSDPTSQLERYVRFTHPKRIKFPLMFVSFHAATIVEIRLVAQLVILFARNRNLPQYALRSTRGCCLNKASVSNCCHHSFSLRKCLIWLEMSAGTIAVTAFVINSLVMASAKVHNAPCRGYFFALLNLAFAQCLLSLVSLAGVMYSLWLLDYNESLSTHKDGRWCSVLHNIIHAIHLLSMPGTAALSLSHWWTLNISANHAEMATDYRIVKVLFCAFWFFTFLFAMWLNFLTVFWGAGLTTTMAENDRRTIQPCLRIYSLTLIASACLLFFSNLSSIPPVTGHLTTRAIQNNHQKNCQDADCFCSDSSDYGMPSKTFPNISLQPVSQPGKALHEHPLKAIMIPTIVTIDENDHVDEIAPQSSINDNQLIHSDTENNLQPSRCEQNQDFLSSQFTKAMLSSPASPACGISVYSADVSTTSVKGASADNKLSTEKLHHRLQQLNDARMAFLPDPDSRSQSQSSHAHSRPESNSNFRRRPKKRRKQVKKYKGLKQIQWENPTSVQITIMLSFVIFYFPPWFLLVAGNHMPQYATIFLSIFRLLVNVGSSINPVLQGFRHPRFALKMVRTWRKIYPSSVTISNDSLIDVELATK
ncbi:hypothetical protein GHT06_009081 [Daphnia sinensis]|uniref:G-protein coupled receptors family 1 profile domain-containing protein n=1 Tax=Daphnia sinensis TaxID=1820382 RepID=A0AAD5LWD3_9CRUS|nr:hypothetical protein GHT06_009081 [Daphnia sinensis]